MGAEPFDRRVRAVASPGKAIAGLRASQVDYLESLIELAREGMTGASPAVPKTIEGFGVKVVRLSAEERAAFQKATKPVYEKWSRQVGPELVKKAEGSIAARKKKT